MKKYFWFTILLLFGCGLCFSQESATNVFDADIAAVKSYQAGGPAEMRNRLEAALYSTELDAAAQGELRRRLTAVFREATPDGQAMLYRLLFPSITEESALPLLSLLTEPDVDAETAKLALMIVQEAPGEKIDAAILDALTQARGDLTFGLIAAAGYRKMNSAVPRLGELARNEKDAPLAEAALFALAQISSGEAVRILESFEASGKLSERTKDALARTRERKNPERRGAFMTSPYDPDFWPGQTAGQGERVDVNKMVDELKTRWLAETDPAQKKERARQFASKASLLARPSNAFIDLLQKTDQLNDQKELLAAMGEKCASPDVIEFAKRVMKEAPPLRSSAGLALVRIANQIRRTDPTAAKEILQTVREQVQNDDIIKRAGTVLASIGENEGMIRDWLYAGPFAEEGKSGEEMFRRVVAAEADRPEVFWLPLLAGWESGRRWNLSVGIEPYANAAACLKTYVWSETDQELVFQAASTGGVAAWCDKKPILNQWRDGPLELWTFSAPVSLKKGYNTLIVKTSCADKGWYFTARLRTRDDQTPNNIRVESRRKDPPPKVLLFTASQTWVHSPTAGGPHGNSCAELILKDICRELGFELVWTDSGEVLNGPLDDYAAFIFYTCGELNEQGRNGHAPVTEQGMQALISAVREKGKGFFAIHSGSDTWHNWPDYIKMVGAEFVTHGMQQEAEVQLVGAGLPQTEKFTGKRFRHFEEWYTFRNFNPDIHVLMMQDTSKMITDGMSACYKQPPYPCTWIRAEGQGIAAFTSLGHSCEYWRTPEYRALLSELLRIVTRKQEADLTPNFDSVMNLK